MRVLRSATLFTSLALAGLSLTLAGLCGQAAAQAPGVEAGWRRDGDALVLCVGSWLRKSASHVCRSQGAVDAGLVGGQVEETQRRERRRGPSTYVTNFRHATLVAAVPGNLTRFEPARVSFATLGEAPSLLRWSTEAVGRGTRNGATRWTRRDDANPTAVSATRLDDAHGTVTERNDLRNRGVEQSFVFDELPAGGVDLSNGLHVTIE